MAQNVIGWPSMNMIVTYTVKLKYILRLLSDQLTNFSFLKNSIIQPEFNLKNDHCNV